MDKVLVTGASGLLGRELCKQLRAEGYYVAAVDNNFRYKYIPDCDEYNTDDITNYTSTVANDYKYVFHMGNINGTKYFYDIPNQLIESNINADFAVFNFVKQNPNCKLIYASSSEVVAGSTEFPTAEQTDICIKDIHNPRWSYRLGKIVGENYLMNSSLNFLILRFFNIFGTASGPGHFVRDVLDKIDNGDFTLIGADETRSFIRVEDSVDAILNIFNIASNDIVNIGSNEEITVLEAANILAAHKNKTIEWQFAPSNVGSVKRRRPDITKLLELYPSFKPAKFKDAIGDL